MILKPEIEQLLAAGTVIPAHPLALDRQRRMDERRQRALTRYYLDSEAGGIAVGVHTTQFEHSKTEVDLFEPVLELAAQEVKAAQLDRPFIQVAGIVGPTDQAVREAALAVKLATTWACLATAA